MQHCFSMNKGDKKLVNKTNQTAWVALSSGCSFIFVLLSSVILSRLLSQGDYGTYKQVMYVYSTLLGLFTLGLPSAYAYFIPHESENSTRSLVGKIELLFWILGGIFSLFLYMGASYISILLNNEELADAIAVFSVVPFFLLPTMGIESVLACHGKAKLIALYNTITKACMLFTVTVPVLLYRGGCETALKGFVVASLVNLITGQILKYIVLNKGKKRSEVSYRDILNFSLPLLFANIWGMIVNSSDQFFLSRYFGRDEFAIFSNGAIELPIVGMVVGACSIVLSPVYAKLRNKGQDIKTEVYRLWLSVFEKSALIVYPFLIFTIIFSDFMVVSLFGEGYEKSSSYYAIKTIKYFLHVMTFGPLLINSGKVKLYSRAFMVSAFATVITTYIIVNNCDSPLAIPLVTTVIRIVTIMYFLYLVAKCLSVKIYMLFPWKRIAQISIIALIVSVILKIAVECTGFNEGIISFALLILIFCVLYMILAVFFKLPYFMILKTAIK